MASPQLELHAEQPTSIAESTADRLLVWAVGALLVLIAILEVTLSRPGPHVGRYANIVLLAAGASALTIAVRRVRLRTEISDLFFFLVLLNPLLYINHSAPFDKTLIATGILALMTGGIIAMNRDNVLRYIAVITLALSLALISPGFLMILPTLVVWVVIAGWLMTRSRASRFRGYVILATGEIGLFIFGLACVLEQPTLAPAPTTLFSRIITFIDFPLLVLAIVILALGWRKGPNGKTPPHLAGILALLLGLLTMLLNNFTSEELPPPGTDQTVLLLCLVYTVFALHGPRRLRWLVPSLLLVAAVNYSIFQHWRG